MAFLNLFKPKKSTAKIAHKRLMKLIIPDVDKDLIRLMKGEKQRILDMQKEIIGVIEKYTGLMIEMDTINFHVNKIDEDGAVRLEVSIPFNSPEEDSLQEKAENSAAAKQAEHVAANPKANE